MTSVPHFTAAALALLACGDVRTQSPAEQVRLAETLQSSSWRQRNAAARRLLEIRSPSADVVDHVRKSLATIELPGLGDGIGARVTSLGSGRVHDLEARLRDHVSARAVDPPQIPEPRYGRPLRTADDLCVPLAESQLAVFVLDRWSSDADIGVELRSRLRQALSDTKSLDRDSTIQAMAALWRSGPEGQRSAISLLEEAERNATAVNEVDTNTRCLIAAIALGSVADRRWLETWALSRPHRSAVATLAAWCVDGRTESEDERARLHDAACDALLAGRLGPSTAAWIPDERVEAFVDAAARACLDDGEVTRRNGLLEVLETRVRTDLEGRRGQLRLAPETEKVLAAAARATGEPILVRCLWKAADSPADAERVAVLLADLAGGLESLRADVPQPGTDDHRHLRSRLPGYRTTGDASRLTYEALFATGRVWRGLDSTAALPDPAILLLQHALCSQSTLERYAAALAVRDLGSRGAALAPYCAWHVPVPDRFGELAYRLKAARNAIAYTAEARSDRLSTLPMQDIRQVRKDALQQCIELDRPYPSDPLPDDLTAILLAELPRARKFTDSMFESLPDLERILDHRKPPRLTYLTWLLTELPQTRSNLPYAWPRIDWVSPPRTALDWIAVVDDPDLLAERVVALSRTDPLERHRSDTLCAVLTRLCSLTDSVSASPASSDPELLAAAWKIALADHQHLEVETAAIDLLESLSRTPAERTELREVCERLLPHLLASERELARREPSTASTDRLGRTLLRLTAGPR